MVRGGPRKGAGRPKATNRKEKYTVRLRPDQKKWMNENLGRFEKNAFVRKAIDEKIERILLNE